MGGVRTFNIHDFDWVLGRRHLYYKRYCSSLMYATIIEIEGRQEIKAFEYRYTSHYQGEDWYVYVEFRNGKRIPSPWRAMIRFLK